MKTLPYNHKTNLVYTGQNLTHLIIAQKKNGFKSNAWITFLQAKELGYKVKKGSKGVSIFKGFGKKTVKDENGKNREISVINGYARVFNLDQMEVIRK